MPMPNANNISTPTTLVTEAINPRARTETPNDASVHGDMRP